MSESRSCNFKQGSRSLAKSCIDHSIPLAVTINIIGPPHLLKVLCFVVDLFSFYPGVPFSLKSTY